MAANIPYNLQEAVVRQVRGAVVVGVPHMMADAIRQGTRQLPALVETLGQAIDLSKLPRSRMKAANQRIAEHAQAAVVRGWYSRLPRKTWAGSANRETGKLGPALANPANTKRTTDRVISFADAKVLNQEAKHWYRVNYGAAGSRYGEGRTARRFVMQLNGHAFASFRDDLRPDPISWIPVRRTFDSDGNMLPLSKQVERSPFGARAARFFELGHSVVAREAPQAYTDLWFDYLHENGGAARRRMEKAGLDLKGELRLTRAGWTARVRT